MIREMPKEPRRILIVRLGAIGDVVRVLPMLNGLRHRFPDAEIDWVVQSKASDVLENHPQIDRLFVVPFTRWRRALSPEAWALRRRVRSRDYDLVLDFQGMFKGAVWAVAGGGTAVRVGWSPGHVRNLAWLWYHGHRCPTGRRINRHLRHRSLVDWLEVPDLPGVPLPFPEEARAVVDRFTVGLGDSPRPWILAYPGSSRSGSHKRWDTRRFSEALETLRRQTGGTVLLGWGPAEEEEARELAASLTEARVIPPTTIAELTFLLSQCDLYIGMDTGPMHLAALVGTPVVGIFGRSDPAVHGPADYLSGTVVAGPAARHWHRRERKGLEPFQEPDPGEVVLAALDLLDRGAE